MYMCTLKSAIGNKTGGLWHELHAQVKLLGKAGHNLQYFSLKNTRSLMWDFHEALNLQFAISINRNANK
jgi:hypothetical protein